jgi:putative ABC transport system permease protein
MRPLTKKLFRDIVRMRWQVITIALVVAAGVANVRVVSGTYDVAALGARDRYYAAQTASRTCWPTAERAPLAASSTELAAIEGSRGCIRAWSSTASCPSRACPSRRAPR